MRRTKPPENIKEWYPRCFNELPGVLVAHFFEEFATVLLSWFGEVQTLDTQGQQSLFRLSFCFFV